MKSSGHLASASVTAAVIGLPLWVASYAWLIHAGPGEPPASVIIVVVAGEIGAVLASALAIGLGCVARRRSTVGSPEFPRARLGVRLGWLVLALVVLPNLYGHFLR